MNQKGFGLIETVIAVGVLGIVIAAVMQSFTFSLQSVSYLEDKISRLNLEQQVKHFINSKESCNESFKNMNISSLPANFSIKADDGTVVFNPSTNSSFEGLDINSLIVEQGNPPVASGTGGVANIILKTSRKSTGGGPAELSPIIVPVHLRADSAGLITDCGAMTSKIAMLPVPKRIIDLSFGGPVTCSQIKFESVNLNSFVAVPENATHGILRFLADINVASGNAGLNAYAGPSALEKVRVIMLDGGASSSKEANSSAFQFASIDSTLPEIYGEMQGRCIDPRSTLEGSLRIYLDGFLIAD